MEALRSVRTPSDLPVIYNTMTQLKLQMSGLFKLVTSDSNSTSASNGTNLNSGSSSAILRQQ